MSPLRIRITPEQLAVPLAELPARINKKKVGLGTPIHVQPMQYPPVHHISWHSDALLDASVSNITLPTPLQIWTFPDSLTQLRQTSVANMEEHSLPLFYPQWEFKVEKLDPDTRKMRLMDPGTYQWNFATKIDLKIKRLKSPTSSSKIEVFTYQLVGVKESDIVLLERMLQNKDELNASNGLIKLLYPSVKKGELTSGSHNVDIFLMQFNLSTETNPSRSLIQPQPGNDDAFTFISKLWEGSITRSGGYYMFYYNQESKEGLPDHLFGDNHEASVSLMVVFPDPPESKFQIRSYTNCVVTGGIENEIIEANTSASYNKPKSVYMEVIRSNVRLTYDSRLSMRDHAETYFSDPAEIAEHNSGSIVDPNTKLLVIDGIYTVSADGPQEIVGISNRFGIEQEELIALNPHLENSTSLLGVPLRLPSKEYENVRNLATGDGSLQMIASFFGTTVSSLAQSNQDRTNLFVPGTTLDILTGPTIRSAQLSQGVIELTGERDIPKEDPTSVHDTSAYVETLFHMLGYEIQSNTAFHGFDPGLPISPMEKDQKWIYTKAIPYTNLLKLPPNTKKLISPYYGIGSLLQLRYVWMDVFGNRLVDIDNRDGTMLVAPIFFTDPLLGPAQWPGVTSSYFITSTQQNGEIAKLSIQFRFQQPTVRGTITDSIKRQALEQSISLYRAATQLLHRMPNQQGNVGNFSVQCNVVTSLLKHNYYLTIKEQDSLARWLLAQVKSLNEWAGNERVFTEYVDFPIYDLASEHRSKQHNLVIEIPLNDLNSLDIFELTTDFVMNRDQAYVSPSLRGNSEITCSSTTIHPVRIETDSEDGENRHAPLLAFATKLEQALRVKGVYRMKVAVGSNREHWNVSTMELPIWLVRIAMPGGRHGLRLHIDGRPVVYAPRPLTNVAEFVPYKKTWLIGKGGSLSFSEGTTDVVETINMEWRARGFLAAIDEILAPAYMSAFEQLYKYGQSSDGTKTHYMNELLKLKEHLAGIIAKQLNEVFSGDCQQNADYRDKAIEKFRQQLKMELSKAYYTDAIVQFNQANARGDIRNISETTETEETKWKSKFYGEVIPKVGEVKFQDNIVLSHPKVEIHPDGAVMADTSMSFVVSGYKEDAALSALSSYVSFDAGYLPTHIEHQIASIEGIPEYQASSWLYFVKAEQVESELYQPFEDTIKVPLPLRAYPEFPSLTEQIDKDPLAGRNREYFAPLRDELKWDYSLTYSRPRHYPQDRVYVTMRFNDQPEKVSFTDTEFDDLRTTLEQFNDCFPAVSTVMKENLSKWELSETPQWDTLSVPYASMHTMTAKVIEKWDDWINAMKPEDALVTRGHLSDLVNEYHFYIEESDPDPNDGHSEWLIYLEELNVCPFKLTPSIDIPGYTADMNIVNIGTGSKEGLRRLQFRFKKKDNSGLPLEASVGISIPQREISLQGLDILKARRVKTSFYITRNEELIKGCLSAEPFVYRTSEITFPRHLLPSLIRDYPIPMNIGDSRQVPKTLIEHLETFFQMLFGTEELDEMPLIQMECTYSFKMDGEVFNIPVPVAQMAKKVCNPKQDFVIREEWSPTYLVDTDTEHNKSSMIHNVTTLFWRFMEIYKPSRNKASIHFKIEIMCPYDVDQQDGILKHKPVQLLQLTDVYLDVDQISQLPPVL